MGSIKTIHEISISIYWGTNFFLFFKTRYIPSFNEKVIDKFVAQKDRRIAFHFKKNEIVWLLLLTVVISCWFTLESTEHVKWQNAFEHCNSPCQLLVNFSLTHNSSFFKILKNWIMHILKYNWVSNAKRRPQKDQNYWCKKTKAIITIFLDWTNVYWDIQKIDGTRKSRCTDLFWEKQQRSLPNEMEGEQDPAVQRWHRIKSYRDLQ